jgi:hypothetical protein
MGTSNWQNIPFCVEVLMKINPQRVLDIGAGFGRWGMVVREFCDVWYGHVHRENWQVVIEGVEAYPQNIDEYHKAFYNKIHIGDFRTVRAEIGENWDVILFGDVLEHFEKPEALRLLAWAIKSSHYVMINIPLGPNWEQVDVYENPYERHLSAWEKEEFRPYSLRRYALFEDYIGRPFGSFILSIEDPKDIASQLFSQNTILEERDKAAGGFTSTNESRIENMQLRDQLALMEDELAVIKKSFSYRLGQAMHRSAAGRLFLKIFDALIDPYRAARLRLEDLQPLPADQIRITALNKHNPESEGNETWLLDVVMPKSDIPFDLRQANRTGSWEVRPNIDSPSSYCLITPGNGRIQMPADFGANLSFLTHPNSGMVEINWQGRKSIVDLFSFPAGKLVLKLGPNGFTTEFIAGKLLPGEEPVQTKGLAKQIGTAGRVGVETTSPDHFSALEQSWIEKTTCEKPAAIAVVNPHWRGVFSSTAELFRSCYLVGDDVNEKAIIHRAHMLLETECPRVVISGFSRSHFLLTTTLKKMKPDLKIYDFWHGNFMQTNETAVWYGFRTIEQLCRAGIIYKWGFAKKGMAEVLAASGLRTGFVMNRINRIPESPSAAMENGPHIGIWAIESIWRKAPYAMLAAARLVPNTRVYAAGADESARELARLLRLDIHFFPAPIPQEQMAAWLAKMSLNLYVTMSECAPMLPLESLSVGAPCLLGPNSHYFEDNEYLHSRLVVPYPDSAFAISRCCEQALAERTQIVKAYMGYAPGYNARSEQSVKDFLEVDTL